MFGIGISIGLVIGFIGGMWFTKYGNEAKEDDKAAEGLGVIIPPVDILKEPCDLPDKPEKEEDKPENRKVTG